MKATIYHNSRCSKSRATLDLLQANGIEPNIIYYLESPPTREELSRLMDLLGKRPDEIIRFGESVAKELRLSPRDERSSDEWIEIMVTNPILIERPIVVVGEQAVLGRPPGNVLSLI